MQKTVTLEWAEPGDEQLKDMDRTMEHEARRLKVLTRWAKKHPDGYIRHIQRVLNRVTRDEYKKYVREVKFISKSLNDDEWSEHSSNLKYSRNGAFIYLRLKLSDRDYFTIGEAAGIEADVITAMISQRAMKLYPPHKAVTAPIPKELTDYRTATTDTHKVPNDRDTLKFFEQEDKHVKAGKMKVNENPRAKKVDQTYSIISFGKQGGGTLDHKLGGFDKSVLTSYYSLAKAGNTATTVDVMYAHMNGRDGRLQPSKKMRDSILNSIRTMATTWIVTEFDLNHKFNYENAKSRYEGNLIEARIQSTIINGKPTEDAIIIKGFSPLVELAEAKDQILSYPKALLNIPEVACTEDTIIIKEELLRRIEGMKKHGLDRMIVLDEAFKGIGYKNMDKQQKRRTRDKALKMMDHWKNEGYIFNYRIIKQGQTPVKFEVLPEQPKNVTK